MNNNTQNLTIIKPLAQNDTVVKEVDGSYIYSIVVIIILIVLISLILKFKRKFFFIPITTLEEYNKESENIYKDSLQKKDWDMMKDILNDSSFSKDIHRRAKKALEDAGEL